MKGFFVVSGFLIFMSFERSSSVSSYAKKRIRRIYPAYFTVVMLCAIGLFAVSSKGFADYFSFAWVGYVLANLLFVNFLHPALPGVFDGNTFTAVNGALWTLKIEVLFYISVPLFVFLFRRFNRLSIIAAFYLLSVAYSVLFSWVAKKTGSDIYLELGRQLPGQLSYFMAGGFFYYYLPTFERYTPYYVLGALFVLAANRYWPLSPFEPFALATIVVFFALYLYMGNFGKYGDFSYGVYILHFPIIQCLVYSARFTDRPWLLLAVAVLATVAAAIAMWHLVEKRFLLRNSHYVAASR